MKRLTPQKALILAQLVLITSRVQYGALASTFSAIEETTARDIITIHRFSAGYHGCWAQLYKDCGFSFQF